MRNSRNLVLSTIAAALLAGCGGGDPDQVTAVAETAAATTAPKALAAPAAPVPVIAGRATTQEAVDSAIAAHAMTRQQR
jgi:type IV pilus biogenesis protein CpaD/CtpE